jgi:hypothetical protein
MLDPPAAGLWRIVTQPLRVERGATMQNIIVVEREGCIDQFRLRRTPAKKPIEQVGTKIGSRSNFPFFIRWIRFPFTSEV